MDGVVNPIHVIAQPTISGINAVTLILNDIMATSGYIQKTSPGAITTTVMMGSTTLYATHKIENSNVFRINPLSRVSIAGVFYKSKPKTNVADFNGAINVIGYYDGVDTYLGTTNDLSYDSNTYNALTIIPIMPAFYNRQLSSN